MYSIPQSSTKQIEIDSFIIKFLKNFQVGKLLFKCNAGKEKGVPVMDIFKYLICLVFSDRSMYMQLKTGTFTEDFKKNTVYRFLNNAHINWNKFLTLLSARVIIGFMKPLTKEDRKDVFIIDDSLYSKARSKKAELLATVFDHCSMKYTRGFRMLTLGWSDGNSFVPINHALLSAADDKNLLVQAKNYDGRSLAGRRRTQSRRKATDVMVELLSSAAKAGITAKYVLFDSWFSSPKVITKIKTDLHLDVIAMVKKSSKIYYGYNGEMLSVKQIYSRNRKRRGRSKYLLSVDVTVGKEAIPAKIIYVRNKSNRKDWLAIISTDNSITEEEAIRVYGKRWDIEVFFKSCKSYLKLLSECRSLSFDALNAHVAIVFSRYMLLSVAQRSNEDNKTICELFYVLLDEMDDITFSHSMRIIMEAMIEAAVEIFQISDAQLEQFTDCFFSKLPKYMQECLKSSSKAA